MAEQYDPNPYDNITVEEALTQLFNRFTPRTVRQAIFTMADALNVSDYFEVKVSFAADGTGTADKAWQQIENAWRNGKLIYVSVVSNAIDGVYFGEPENMLCNAHATNDQDELRYLSFATSSIGDGEILVSSVTIHGPNEEYPDGVITFASSHIEAPVYPSSD